MAVPKHKKPSVAQVLKLVDQFSPAEVVALKKELDNNTWGDELDELFNRIDKRNKHLPPLSEEEIKAERAQRLSYH